MMTSHIVAAMIVATAVALVSCRTALVHAHAMHTHQDDHLRSTRFATSRSAAAEGMFSHGTRKAAVAAAAAESEARAMFWEGFDAYMRYAYPADELRCACVVVCRRAALVTRVLGDPWQRNHAKAATNSLATAGASF